MSTTSAQPKPRTAFAVETSDNAKTGRVHATYASQSSCPASCPLKNAGCYAEHGPVGFHTARLNRAAVAVDPLDVAREEAASIREVLSGRHDLRLHVVGDCATNEAAATVSEAALETLRTGSRPWTYTHASETVDRASWGAVSVLASGETPAQMLAAMDRGYATAMVVPEFLDDKLYADRGLKILPCVNQTRDVKCTECRICFDDKRLLAKGITIGFTPHGSRWKKLTAMLPTLQ